MQEYTVHLKERYRYLLVVLLLLTVDYLHLAEVVLQTVSSELHQVGSLKDASLEVSHFMSNVDGAEAGLGYLNLAAHKGLADLGKF